jgi:AraC family transcriptional activator of pobA
MPHRPQAASTYYDPRQGDPPIRITPIEIDAAPFEPPRTNLFTIDFIESGAGEFWADAARFQFTASTLLFFVPYQHIRIVPTSPVRGNRIQFHANFLCVETFHAESGCSGVLFNDPAGVPIVTLNPSSRREIHRLIQSLKQEQTDQRLAHTDLMLAQLKVLLILATRIKATPAPAAGAAAFDPRHPLLIDFRNLIETHYRALHAPADYADLLHVTPKTLGRIVRDHLDATPTELIRARILTHAKWQLLHTLRPVKEIAREVGFTDELYFTRLFKKATGCSPTFFREFETTIRNGSNLSMLSSQAPILTPSPPVDTSSRSKTRPTGR